MKQPVDSFFNKKLENYNGAAPAAAWDRIDANLSQKKKPLVWLKIAASLLLVALAGFIVYNTTLEQPAEQLAAVQTVLPVEKEVPVAESLEPELEKIQAAQPQVVIPKTSGITYSKRKEVAPITKTQPVEEPVEIALVPVVVIAENTADPMRELTENLSETKTQNTTIVISAEEANAKYLNQQFIADATPETKKSSKIRNLFEKAQELDPIGEIRQFKNEVIAMNFRNEKKGERNR